jgi:phosphoribosylaminoimidazolecarboxamide formyltransferase/IMP cyclohydrolase
VLKPGVRVDECIENIDIGGPGMLRAAAKNHGDVTVLVDPADYATVLGELRAGGATTPATRLALARKVFEHTAAYDALIAGYFRQIAPAAVLPAQLTLTYERVTGLRYGENPHQTADFYREALPVPGSLAVSEQLNGKELSYNNLADTDAAVALLREFTEPTVVAVKHANPCGVGSADTLLEAWRKAYDADPVSIFGGIVALNRPVDLAVAQATKGVFLEVMIAPDYTPEALAHLQERQNLRVMRLPSLNEPVAPDTLMQKQILGGLLIQGPDDQLLDPAACRTVTRVPLDPACQSDLLFALKVVKHTRSNAIVLARDGQTVGIGNGQPNRITSVEIAVKNAGSQAAGSVMASDAFFPFDDCVRAAAAAGVAAIVQPGGSVRDQASIDACDELGLPMLFTGIRHFRH